jgi:hypothetical protein
MDIYHTRRLQIELRDDEIETLKEVVRLAHTQLRNAPCIQMHGNPGQKQAGLVGPQLFQVKTMLEKFGQSVGVDCPYDAAPEASFPVATL